MKVGIILGTRPEAIKLIPLYKKLRSDSTFNPVLISTGQHKEMLDQIFDFFEVVPDHNLKIMTKAQSLSALSARLFRRLDSIIKNENFDLIVVQGDTTTSMIGAFVGFYHKIKIAHIEAGLRSEDIYSPFPEEINRKTISTIANYHFAATMAAVENLKIEGHVQNVFLVGNTVVDSVFYGKKILVKNQHSYKAFFRNIIDVGSRNIVITIHRRENYQNKIREIFKALRDLSEKFPAVNFIYPIHKNPILRKEAKKYFSGISNFKLIEPLGYDYFLYLLINSYFIISDSGGLQEEAPSLNKPILIIRDTTERPEIISSGGGILVGTAYNSIIDNVSRLIISKVKYNSMINIKNPFGDGKSIHRIISQIKKIN